VRIIQQAQERVTALVTYAPGQDRGSKQDILADMVFNLSQAKQAKLIHDRAFPRLFPIFVLCKDGSQHIYFLSASRNNRSWAEGDERALNNIEKVNALLHSRGLDLSAAVRTICPVSFISFLPAAKQSPRNAKILRVLGLSRAYMVACDVPPNGAGATLLSNHLTMFVNSGSCVVSESMSTFSLKVWQKAAAILGTSVLHVDFASKPPALVAAPSRTTLAVLASKKTEMDPKRVADRRAQ
jgi:hypothetical protein